MLKLGIPKCETPSKTQNTSPVTRSSPNKLRPPMRLICCTNKQLASSISPSNDCVCILTCLWTPSHILHLCNGSCSHIPSALQQMARLFWVIHSAQELHLQYGIHVDFQPRHIQRIQGIHIGNQCGVAKVEVFGTQGLAPEFEAWLGFLPLCSTHHLNSGFYAVRLEGLENGLWLGRNMFCPFAGPFNKRSCGRDIVPHHGFWTLGSEVFSVLDSLLWKPSRGIL